ncbi:ATP-grasp domain-containing protein [Variovorax sp. PCZ-1]|uniref:ATP-grasp domain-containing protein n=1 Tax=Variovorax sp. PCZ-1 TaxID=2835533 RepID=UPI001BCDF8F7|nr:ATP-grasp domain-containing protein [Variovorax sp. PCZ-1]MBS7807454.1 ATP-grasp domain-containing protein [Variovorax sp. PCZ-1]
MPKTLLLFNYDWDATATQALAAQGHAFDVRGFDLFSFPSNANLPFFRMERFVNKLASQAKREGWQAVSSQHEQFGALAAALLAEKMGWPGTSSKAVAACQHKLYARQVLEQVAPEANVKFTRLPCAYGEDVPEGLHFPAFVKPVKAAFSVLAQVVRSREELQAFTRFGAYELWVIKHLVRPFEEVCEKLLPEAGTAHSMLLEEPVRGAQYSLDGIAFGGEIKPLGVVDSIMYPGTQAFMRFDYPSRLPQAAQDQALDVAKKFLHAVGFTHGMFNMEFFYDTATQTLKVIEFNPRMASQFSDLYQRVDGINLHAMAVELAYGRDPWALKRLSSTAGVASSFVYRVFDERARHLPQRIPSMPEAWQIAQLQAQFPDHFLLQFPKAGHSLARDFKWLGSYRYGILHLSGRDAHDLQERCQRASGILHWPIPYASELSEELSAPMVLPNTRAIS